MPPPSQSSKPRQKRLLYPIDITSFLVYTCNVRKRQGCRRPAGTPDACCGAEEEPKGGLRLRRIPRRIQREEAMNWVTLANFFSLRNRIFVFTLMAYAALC